MKSFLIDLPRASALRALNYSPTVESIRRAGSSSARSLRDLLIALGPAYGSVFTRIDCCKQYGVELITQGDMFAAEPTGRVIRLDSMAQPERHFVRRGQVLIAGAGTLGENELYGRSILADGRLEGKYVGPHSMSLHFADPDADLSLFTYAWLTTPTGLQAIRSTSYGTKILGIRKDLLGSLPVPDAPRAIVARVAELIRHAVQSREAFADAIKRSRAIVGQLPEIKELIESSGRTARHVIWNGPLTSLCAWNYAAGGGLVGALAKKWSTRLRELLQPGGVFNGPRFARVDCSPPHGIEFLSQRDIFLIRPIGRRIVRPEVPDRLLFVPREALLVGSHGQLNEGSLFGKVELASYAGWKAGVTQDILRALPRDGYREFVYAFLSTTVGQGLLKSTAVGTSIPSMRLDLLESLPCPNPSDLPLSEIREHVRNAEFARIAADDAESQAVSIIEQEVVPQWLA